MVGSKSEHGGSKRWCQMVNAVSNSVVPKFTVIINSYGAGNYAMCGKA
jgi:acetyl-CoA carboxylase carboxyltransferase component